MKKIIFSRNFALAQSIMIFILILFILPKSFVIEDNVIKISFLKYSLPTILTITLYIVSILILSVLFTKKGVLIENKKLYKAHYLFSKVIYRKEIALNNISDISILKFRGRVVNNDFSYTPMSALLKTDYKIERDEIYLLNKTHTIKRFLIHTNNNEFAKNAVEIIKNELNLDFKQYNPRFYD